MNKEEGNQIYWLGTDNFRKLEKVNNEKIMEIYSIVDFVMKKSLNELQENSNMLILSDGNVSCLLKYMNHQIIISDNSQESKMYDSDGGLIDNIGVNPLFSLTGDKNLLTNLKSGYLHIITSGTLLLGNSQSVVTEGLNALMLQIANERDLELFDSAPQIITDENRIRKAISLRYGEKTFTDSVEYFLSKKISIEKGLENRFI